MWWERIPQSLAVTVKSLLRLWPVAEVDDSSGQVWDRRFKRDIWQDYFERKTWRDNRVSITRHLFRMSFVPYLTAYWTKKQRITFPVRGQDIYSLIKYNIATQWVYNVINDYNRINSCCNNNLLNVRFFQVSFKEQE